MCQAIARSSRDSSSSSEMRKYGNTQNEMIYPGFQLFAAAAILQPTRNFIIGIWWPWCPPAKVLLLCPVPHKFLSLSQLNRLLRDLPLSLHPLSPLCLSLSLTWPHLAPMPSSLTATAAHSSAPSSPAPSSRIDRASTKRFSPFPDAGSSPTARRLLRRQRLVRGAEQHNPLSAATKF